MSFRFSFQLILAFLFWFGLILIGCRLSGRLCPPKEAAIVDFIVCVLHFDFYFNAGGEFEFHQGVDCLGCRVVDVDEALESGKLELLAGFLVYESRAVDGEDALVGGQGNGTRDNCTGGLHGLYDFLGGFVDEIVIVRFEFDANFLAHI